MNELDSKIAKLESLQSEIPQSELKNICTYIEKYRHTFPPEPAFIHFPIDTQFSVRLNNLSGEIDIFLDREKPFGQGQIRIVMRSLQYNREEIVAVKILQTKRPTSVERFLRDISNLQTFQNEPGIASIYEFYQIKNEDYDHLEMVQRFYNQGSLHQCIKHKIPDAMPVIKQILTTIARIHQKGYLLQDFCPKNCLIDVSNHTEVGIGDLEMLVPIDSINPNNFDWHANKLYAPPEFWKYTLDLMSFADIPKQHWQKIDMWGVGCCLWTLLSDSPPPWIDVHIPDPVEMLERTTLEITEPEDLNSLEHLLWEMLQEDPSQRIDSQQALKKLTLKN